MITVRKLAIGVGALSALASAAHAQNGATQTGTATGSATIIQPIQASSTANLGFGTIVKPSTGTATVAVDATGNRTLTGTVAANTGGVSAAAFSIIGESGSAYSVTVPTTFAMVSGTNTLVVTTVNNASGATLPGAGIGNTGTATFGVGGNFTLNSSTTSGAYTGNIVVTAQYN